MHLDESKLNGLRGGLKASPGSPIARWSCFLEATGCVEAPFIPAKAGIQEELGPRFRGDERTGSQASIPENHRGASSAPLSSAAFPMRARQSRSSPDGAEEKNPRASRRARRGGEAARKRLSAGMSRSSVAVKS